MAIVYRSNGDSIGVLNVDAGRSQANGAIINTGIAAPLTAIKISQIQSTGSGIYTPDLATELGAPNALGVSGAVETILRTIQANASVLAYQVDNNGQVSVLVERSSWATDTAIRSALVAAGAGGVGSTATYGNIGAYGNVGIGIATAVSTTGGLKLA